MTKNNEPRVLKLSHPEVLKVHPIHSTKGNFIGNVTHYKHPDGSESFGSHYTAGARGYGSGSHFSSLKDAADYMHSAHESDRQQSQMRLDARKKELAHQQEYHDNIPEETINEVEDPDKKYYEPKSPAEKQFWKLHLIQKHLDPQNGEKGDEIFAGSNIGKDKSHIKSPTGPNVVDPKVAKAIKTVTDKIKQVKEDSQASTSDNPSAGGPVQGKIDGSDANMNAATKPQASGGIAKDLLEKIALQAAGLYDQLEDNQQLENDAQAKLTELEMALNEISDKLSQDNNNSSNSVKEEQSVATKQVFGWVDGMPTKQRKFWGRTGHLKQLGGDGGDIPDRLETVIKHRAKRTSQNEAKKDPGEYDYEGDMAMSQLKSIMMNAKRLHDCLEPNTTLPDWVQSKITLAEDYITTATNYVEGALDEETENLDEAAVRDNKTDTHIGHFWPDKGFKPTALGRGLGLKAHPSEHPANSYLVTRGRPKGAKGGASKRKDQTADEAGQTRDPITFTDQLLHAADNVDGGPIKFKNGQEHHVPRVHLRAALAHIGQGQGYEGKMAIIKHMRRSKENFDSFRKSGGKLPAPKVAVDPDAKLKAKTARITAASPGGNTSTPKEKRLKAEQDAAAAKKARSERITARLQAKRKAQ